MQKITLKKLYIKKKKRLGRGQGSGKGGTSTRGHKGYKSRSGSFKKLGFEGGQMPLHKRLPKVGFNKNSFQKKKKESIINLDILQNLFEKGKIYNKIIDKNFLMNNGLIQKNDIIKILGRGKLKVGLKIYANKFSKKVVKNIKNLGGECIILK